MGKTCRKLCLPLPFPSFPSSFPVGEHNQLFGKAPQREGGETWCEQTGRNKDKSEPLTQSRQITGGKRCKYSYAHPFPWGTSKRRALMRKMGLCRTFGYDKGFFFFIGEGNGETQGLCQEGMNRQPWKSWDKDY